MQECTALRLITYIRVLVHIKIKKDLLSIIFLAPSNNLIQPLPKSTVSVTFCTAVNHLSKPLKK